MSKALTKLLDLLGRVNSTRRTRVSNQRPSMVRDAKSKERTMGRHEAFSEISTVKQAVPAMPDNLDPVFTAIEHFKRAEVELRAALDVYDGAQTGAFNAADARAAARLQPRLDFEQRHPEMEFSDAHNDFVLTARSEELRKLHSASAYRRVEAEAEAAGKKESEAIIAMARTVPATWAGMLALLKVFRDKAERGDDIYTIRDETGAAVYSVLLATVESFIADKAA